MEEYRALPAEIRDRADKQFALLRAKNVVLRIVGVMTAAGSAIVTVSVTNESFICAQSPKTAAEPAAPPEVRLPDESAGIDGVARTLISAFDQADIVALGETHVWRLDTDLRIAEVRHPDFARKVRSIVVEFGSTTEQATLDRYIRGEDVSSLVRNRRSPLGRKTSCSWKCIGWRPGRCRLLAQRQLMHGRTPGRCRRALKIPICG